jgi:hypothetical protein
MTDWLLLAVAAALAVVIAVLWKIYRALREGRWD